MKNKILKTLLVLGVLFFLAVGGVLAFIVYSLPSTKKISEAITGRSTKIASTQPAAAVQTSSADSTTRVEPVAPAVSGDTTVVSNSTEPEGSTSLDRKGLDNLIDPTIPLSDFCQSLKNSKSGGMNATEFNTQFKKSVDQSVDGAERDSRIQAIKPLLRTIFREPKMQDLITEAASAVENQEENFWQKAAFYSKAAMAFQAMIANKNELNAVGDRSYLFFKMSELVAKRPNLLADQRLQKFCSDTESAFNTDQPVQFDQEKKSFERILDELGVPASEIKYDSNYKSDFDISFDGKSMQLNGGWLEDLIPETGPSEPLN